MKFYSLLIVFLVSAIVFATTGFMIGVSVTSPNSNIHIAERFFRKWKQHKTEAAQIDTTESSASRSPLTPSCDYLNPDDYSLVDYLVTNNAPASFGARASLAEKYNIPDYRGSEAQNESLLSMISASEVCPPVKF